MLLYSMQRGRIMEKNKLKAVELVNTLLDLRVYFEKIVEDTNKDLKDLITIKNGKIYILPDSDIDEEKVSDMLELRDKTLELLNKYPKMKVLKSIIYLLENNKKIENKHYNVIKNFSNDNDSEICDMIIPLFEEHNMFVSIRETVSAALLEKKQKALEEKIALKKEKKDKLIEVEMDANLENVYYDLAEPETEYLNLSIYYYNLLKYPENFDKVHYELVNIIDENQFKIISEIKSMLESDYNTVRDTTVLDEGIYQDNLITVSSKLMLLTEVLYDINNSDLTKKIPDVLNDNTLFYAGKSQGKTYIENDLKCIPDEYLESSYKLLNALKTNNYQGVINKKITNNNNMSDLWVVKIYKVRLYYKLLGKNNVHVLMLTLKKSDNDKFLYSRLNYRISETYSEYKKFENKIGSNVISELEIENQSEIHERILTKVDNKRSR